MWKRFHVRPSQIRKLKEVIFNTGRLWPHVVVVCVFACTCRMTVNSVVFNCKFTEVFFSIVYSAIKWVEAWKLWSNFKMNPLRSFLWNLHWICSSCLASLCSYSIHCLIVEKTHICIWIAIDMRVWRYGQLYYLSSLQQVFEFLAVLALFLVPYFNLGIAILLLNGVLWMYGCCWTWNRHWRNMNKLLMASTPTHIFCTR